METFKRVFSALAMVAILVVGFLGILVVLGVIQLQDITDPIIKTFTVLSIVGLMTVAIYVLQKPKN